MTRALPALGLALLLALAGCIVPEDLQGADAEDLEAAAAAATALSSGSGWYSLPVEAGPDGPLTAAWFTVPEGAVHEYAHNKDFDGDYLVVPVEAAFVFDGAVTPDAVALLTFRHEDGELAADMAMIALPGTMELSDSVLFPGTSDTWEPDLAPGFYHFAFDDDVKAGDRIGIVAGVTSAQSAAGQLLFRVRGAEEGDFQDDEEPEDDVLAFAAGAKDARVLDVAGRGAGIHGAERYESTGGLFLPVDFTYQSGEVVVEGGRTPADAPVTTGRASHWSAQAPGDSGWAFGMAGYISDFAVGAWSGSVAARGEEAEAGGDVVAVPPGMFTSFEFVTALGDGAGPAGAELSVATDGSPNMETLLLLLYGIGTPVSELLGEEAMTHSDALSAGGPLRHDATGWSLPVGGMRIVMPALPEA